MKLSARKTLILLGIIFLSLTIFFTSYLSQQKQEIRKKAAEEKKGIIFLSPSALIKTTGESFPLEIKFNTDGEAISVVNVYLSYSYSGSTPEIEATQIQLNSELTATGDWSFPFKKIETGNGMVKIKISAINLTPFGYATDTDTLLATINFKANKTVNNKEMVFDPMETKMLNKTEGANILQDVVNGKYSVVSCPAPSTPTLTLSLDSETASCTKDDTPTWQWMAEDNGCSIDNYQIDRSWIDNPSDQDYDKETVEASFTPTELAGKTGTYKIKVKAHNARGWSNWSAWQEVTIDLSPPPVPSPKSPPEDSQTDETTPSLEANLVNDVGCQGQVKYQFQVDNNPDFGSPVQTSEWTTNAWKISEPLSVGAYYWRIRAKDGFGNTSSWSEGRKLTINVPIVLNFRIKFQGINQQRHSQTVKVSIKNISFTEDVATSSDQNGIYEGALTLPSTAEPGTYDVFIKGPAHLQKKFSSVALDLGTNTKDWSAVELKAGDVNQDNKITVEDIVDILSLYTDFSVPVDPGTIQDVNGDAKITVEDVVLVLSNYTDFTVPGDE